MKRFIVLLILWSPYGFAQDKIPFADGKEILQQAAQAEQEKDFTKALNLIQRVHPKDSSVCSSLVAKSYYFLNTGELEKAIKLTDSGLGLKCDASRLYLIINRTAGYINNKQLEEGLVSVEEGLSYFPRNYQLWYNKGLVLEKMEKTREAVAAYQQSALLNPSYALPHLRLGNICYKQELTAQAVMAFNMYLLLNPDGADSFEILKSLNDLVQTKNPDPSQTKIEISKDDKSFEQLNLLLDNRLALNEQYKVDTKLGLPLTKQNHLLLSQLASYEAGDDFWARVYVPLYQWVWEKNAFENFSYVISFSVQNETYKKLVRKDIEGLKNFRTALLTEWQRILEKTSFKVLPEDKGNTFDYVDLRIDGIGKTEGETLTGPWKFYNGDGHLLAEGNFDNNGKRTGFWKWTRTDGSLNETVTYREGLLEGQHNAYFDNGKLRLVAEYKNDSLNGTHLIYNRNGALLEKKFFKDGILQGDYQSYFPVGETLKEFDIVYRDGLVEDKAYEYYANGKVYAEMSFKADKKNGPEKKFSRDGILSSEINYVDNTPVGSYQVYHTNGKLKERSNYKNGLFEGTYEIFYEDGSLQSTGNLEEGLYQGVVKYFDRDGKLHYEYDYKNGEIIAYRFFSKSGDVLASGKRKGGEFFYKSYSPYGEITAEGLYDVSGGKKASWKFYSDNGNLSSQGNYIEDAANGLNTEYYETGEKLSEATYERDTLHGYFRSFFPDGQMKSQGWYKKGVQHGEWRSYYANGELRIKNFFHEGEFHNFQEFYGVDGELTSTLLYDYGQVLKESFYHPGRKLFEEVDRSKEGKISPELHHFNGLVSYKTDYVNGIKHGKYSEYDHTGQKTQEGHYINGELDGEVIDYFPTGQKESVLKLSRGEMHGEALHYYEDGALEGQYLYEFGNRIGESKSYHQNGQLEVLTSFVAGKEHGRKEFFDASGNLELVRFYEHGRLMGYSYLNKDSQEIPMIPLHNQSGVIKSYFSNGNPAREMEYVKGEVKGPYRSYHFPGGLKYEVIYSAGEYHGMMKEFHSNGKLKTEKTYHYGELNGPSREYYENGQLKEETHYAYDLKHGKHSVYNEEGKLIKQEQYRNNNIYEVEKI